MVTGDLPMSDDKFIGDYILEDGVCTSDVIHQALARQAALKEENIYRPLGSILIEDFDIDPENYTPV